MINPAMKQDALRKLDTIGRLASQREDELQLFRTNYERIKLTFNPQEPDAIWLADSLARVSPQPYQAMYKFLTSIMLSKLPGFIGIESDVEDIQNVMKWSRDELTVKSFRYADTAFNQLFTHGLIPADGFEFMMQRGNISSLPGMTLLDVALLSLIYSPPHLSSFLLDKRIFDLHRERGDRELLVQYELSKLFHTKTPSYSNEPERDPYWTGLDSLEKIYGPCTAIEYERGMFLQNLLGRDLEPALQTSQQQRYSSLSEQHFRNVLHTATDSFYLENAAIMLERINQPEIILRNMTNHLMPTAKILIPIQYRNVDTLYVTAYLNTNEYGFFFLGRYPDLQRPDIKGPIVQQQFLLPQTVPHCFRTTDLILDSLPSGNWLLMYHTNPVCDSTNTLLAQGITITDISAEQVILGKRTTIFFTDSRTGTPLRRLKVVKEDKKLHRFNCRTDRLGRIRVRTYKDWEFFVHNSPDCVFSFFNDSFEYEDHDRSDLRRFEYLKRQYKNYYEHIPSRIILDRSLYRPGQTVFFNVYLVQKNKMKANTSITAILRDSQKNEIHRISLKTNEFGTASGSFILPEKVFSEGNIEILDETGINLASQHFYMAAYRMPTFQIKLDEMKGSVSAHDTLHFTGRAVSFTGEPIRNAQVSAHLECKGEPNLNYDLQTDSDGSFSFIFKSQDTSNHYLWLYLTISVTDINGETQSIQKSYSLYRDPFYVLVSADDVDLSQEDTLRCKIELYAKGGSKFDMPTKVEIYRVLEPSEFKPLIYLQYRKPSDPIISEEDYHRYFPQYSFNAKDNDIRCWPSIEQMFHQDDFLPNHNDLSIDVSQWKTGLYRIVATAKDSFGRTDTTIFPLHISNMMSNSTETARPLILQVSSHDKKRLEMSVSTGLKNASVYCSVFQNGRKSFTRVLHMSEEQRHFSVRIRPDISIYSVVCHTTQNNRNYSSSKWNWIGSLKTHQATPGTLSLRLTRWNRTLLPGDSTKWELEVSNAKTGKREASEVLAWMIDTALLTIPRSFEFNQWILPYEGFRRGFIPRFAGMVASHDALTFCPYLLSIDYYQPKIESKKLFLKEYDAFALHQFPSEYSDFYPASQEIFQPFQTRSGRLSGENLLTTPGRSVRNQLDNPFDGVKTVIDVEEKNHTFDHPQNRFRIRSNFRETAFFLPQLQTDDSGHVAFSFTVPDQLTTWQFYAQAHTKKLHTGHLSGSMVTKLPMTLQCNAPRFLRVGDTLDLSAKIANLSDEDLDGTVTLEFFDTIGNQPVKMVFNPDCRDAMHCISTRGESKFHVIAGNSREVHFRIIVPEGMTAATYRMVARAGNYGDGEERTLPMMSKRVLVTESQPFFVPAKQDTTIVFSRFLTSGLPTLSHYRYTVEATTNPTWLAIQALPELTHPDYESNDNLFAALFAAATLQQIKRQYPAALPDEDFNSIAQKSINQLKSNQLADGGWSWIGRNHFSQMVTSEVVCGFYKLQRMGVKVPQTWKWLSKAVSKADSVQAEHYQDFLKEHQKNPKKEFELHESDIQYLYMRSFIQEDSSWKSKPYVQNLMRLAVKDIYKASFTRQAEVALILQRAGRTHEAQQIVEALRQQAVKSFDQGMYWRRKWTDRYYPWYEAPIEQQSLIIEAFSEISPREEEISAMKQWLLMQKKGSQWQSSRATMAAVYALLLDKPQTMLNNAATSITVGSETFSTADTGITKGTGHLQHTWEQEAIIPALGKVSVRTDNEHPAIGACHWQYWTTIDSLETAGSGLTVSRGYYHQPTTAGGYAEPVTTDNPARLGERLTVRVTVTSDRWLDFVHVSDPRPAAFEPMNVREQYRWQQNVSWVESPRDESTEFFFQHLPQGTVLIEYDIFATQSGDFSTGAPTVECTYAPEWRAQSTGTRITVR